MESAMTFQEFSQLESNDDSESQCERD